MPKEITITDNDKKVVETSEINTTPQPETDTIQPEKVEPVKTEEVKIKKEILPLKNKKLVIILSVSALLVIVGIASFFYFGIYKAKPLSIAQLFELTTNYIQSKTDGKNPLTNLSAPNEPRTQESPLNGLLFTKTEMDTMMQRRPLAVMQNNHVASRPLSALNSADIVYETLVESGITRIMGIYWSQAPDTIGTVRSARQNYIEWLSPFDALFIHDGCAESTDPRVDACGNLYSYNIKDLRTIGSWRDSTRYAPHNEYNSAVSAWAYAAKNGWAGFPENIKAWKFKQDAVADERGTQTHVKIQFHTRLTNSGDYDTEWTYNPTTNSYLRKVGGQADIDKETMSQINAKTVIIQDVKMISTGDSKGHIIIETIGEGEAVILMDGKIVEGTWKKANRIDRTVFYDSEGKEIEFNRGRVWISAVPHSEGKFDIIEQ